MFKIKFDNKNSHDGNETWYGKEEFKTYDEAEDYLLIRNYKTVEGNEYEEVDHCPMIAYIEEFK